MVACSTWYSWNCYSTTTSTTCTSVWDMWVTTPTTYSTGNNVYVWNQWNYNGTTATTSDTVWRYWTADTVVMADDVWNDTHGTIADPVEAKKAQKREIRRNQKAKRLLHDLIGKEQMKLFEETGRLVVNGKEADYLIERGGRVTEMEKGKVVDLAARRLCVHLAGEHRRECPDLDNVTALVLHIWGNEKGFRETANKHEQFRVPQLDRCANA